MKTKILINTLLILLLCHYDCIAQFICGGIVGSSHKSVNITNNYNNYVPTSDSETKYIRMNFHFIQLNNGSGGAPGNFTEYDDGNGNSNYSGFSFANDLINLANYYLFTNEQMFLPPNNTTPVLETKFYLILNGVFFHQNNNYYYWDDSNTNLINESLGIDLGRAINVFFVHSINNNTVSGHANMNGNRYIKMNKCWERYLSDLSLPLSQRFGLLAQAQTLIHEVGHNLSLFHTMMNGSVCSPTHDDFCSDTPTMGEILTNFGFDPCNNIWGCSANCSNNIMDYSGKRAITPEQLGRIHWTIENEMNEYKKCHIPYGTVQLCNNDFIRQNIFSENVIIGGSQCPEMSILENNRSTRIEITNSCVIYKNFEVKLGSSFSIDVINSCN
jgi:hypothetical protein